MHDPQVLDDGVASGHGRHAQHALDPDNCHYRAFISYSHADQAWARWLHKSLEKWRTPKHLVGRRTPRGIIPARLTPIFRDRDELPSSASLSDGVNRALEQSAHLIVICSPQAAASKWVDKEVRQFQRLDRAERILCLIVAGDPGTTTGNQCLPPSLLRDTPDPGAADVREGKDGRQLAKLKLISGMLGVGLDELRMREHQRKMRRLVLATALAMLATVLTSTLAIVALLARKSAEHQQSQAEGLVGFMIDDLDRRLRGNNRLETLEAIGDRALAYYQSLPSRDVDDSVLAGRAEVMKRLGSIRIDQGRLDEARTVLQTAEKLTATLLERKPADAERMTKEADSLTYLGNVDWYRGRLDEALEHYLASAAVLEKAAIRKPEDSEIPYLLAAARTNAGRILEKRGQREQSERQFRHVLDTFKSLHAKSPGNTRWSSELGFAYVNLAQLAWKRGHLTDSIENYTEALGIQTRLVSSDPGNRVRQSDLALTQALLGKALLKTGQIDKAIVHFQEAARIGRSNVKFDPDNVNDRDTGALYNLLLARGLRVRGNYPLARRQADEALAALSDLSRANPDNAVFRQDLAKAQIEYALLELASGHPRKALHHVEPAIEITRSALARDPQDGDARLQTGQALLTKARIVGAEQSGELLREAHTIMSNDAGRVDDPDQLALMATVQRMLGQTQSAEDIVARLRHMGYRDPEFMRLWQSMGDRSSFNRLAAGQQAPALAISQH